MAIEQWARDESAELVQICPGGIDSYFPGGINPLRPWVPWEPALWHLDMAHSSSGHKHNISAITAFSSIQKGPRCSTNRSSKFGDLNKMRDRNLVAASTSFSNIESMHTHQPSNPGIYTHDWPQIVLPLDTTSIFAFVVSMLGMYMHIFLSARLSFLLFPP
jgi:hypothetical protein